MANNKNTYYINELLGSDDLNNGSINSPFKTFAKIQNNSIIILQGQFNSEFNSELNLANLSNIEIIGDNIIPVSVVPKPIKIPPYTENYTDLNNTMPTYNISNNPTLETIGAPTNPTYNIRTFKMPISNSYNINNIPIKKGIKLTSCINCVIRNCELFSKISTEGWTKEDWNNNAAGVVILYGKGNRIMNCNIYNCGGIQVAGTNCIIANNYITDFPTDGSGLWANNNLFANNRVQNSKVVNNNHNDLFQSSVCVNNFILHNVFIAYTDPNAPFYNTAVQAFGCFDGWYKNYLVKGNIIYNDHPIGL